MVAPPPLSTTIHHPRKRRLSDDSYATSATPLPSVLSATSSSTYADGDSVHSFMAGHVPDQSPLSSSMPPPMSTPMGMGAPLTHSTSAPSPINPPIIKKSRVNTPWTPAEEHRLKLMRDNGDSWAIIAKVCQEGLQERAVVVRLLSWTCCRHRQQENCKLQVLILRSPSQTEPKEVSRNIGTRYVATFFFVPFLAHMLPGHALRRIR